MQFGEWFKTLFFRKRTPDLHEQTVDSLFADGSDVWNEEDGGNSHPADKVFAEDFENSRPRAENVDRILSTRKGTAELLASVKEQGTKMRIVPIALVDRGVMRAGMDIYHEGIHVGWVTSGTMVPYYHFDEAGNILDTTGKRSIGFAYINSDIGADAQIQIDVRGKRLNARLVARHMDQSQIPYGRAIL